MIRPGFAPSVTQCDQPVTVWDALSRAGLARRKNGGTDAQVQRLVKTLQRLCPAATTAMDAVQQTALMNAVSTEPAAFSLALFALSDG